MHKILESQIFQKTNSEEIVNSSKPEDKEKNLKDVKTSLKSLNSSENEIDEEKDTLYSKNEMKTFLDSIQNDDSNPRLLSNSKTLNLIDFEKLEKFLKQHANDLTFNHLEEEYNLNMNTDFKNFVIILLTLEKFAKNFYSKFKVNNELRFYSIAVLVVDMWQFNEFNYLYFKLAQCYFNMRFFEQAFLYFSKSLKSKEKTKSAEEVFKYLGLVSLELNHYSKCKEYFSKEADLLDTKEENIELRVDFLIRLARYKFKINHKDASLKCIKEAEILLEQNNRLNNKSIYINKLYGELYFKYDSLESSLSRLDQALNQIDEIEKKSLKLIENQIDILIKKGDIFLQMEMSQKSLNCFNKALELVNQTYESCDKLDNKDVSIHSRVAQVLAHLGHFYMFIGDFTKSKFNFENSNLIYQKLNANVKDIVYSFNNLAQYHLKKANFESSYSNLTKAYQLNKQMFKNTIKNETKKIGHDASFLVIHPKVAESLFNIGRYYSILGDYKEALLYYQDTIDILEIFYKKDDSIIPSLLLYKTYISLSNACACMSKFEEAFIYLEEALNTGNIIFQNVNLKTINNYYLNFKTIDLLNSYASFYIKIKDYTSAKKYYEIIKEILKELHLNEAQLLSNIGRVSFKLGDYVNAEICFNSSLELYKSHYEIDENQPEIAREHIHLSKLYLSTNEFNHSWSKINLAKTIFQNFYSNSNLNQDWINVLIVTADYFFKVKNFKEVGSCLKDSLLIAEKIFENSYYQEIMINPQIAFIYRKLGHLELVTKNFDSAFSYFDRSRQIIQEYYNITNFKLNKSDLDLAEYFYQLGDVNQSLIKLFKVLNVYLEHINYWFSNQNEYTNNLTQNENLFKQLKSYCHPVIANLLTKISLAYTKYGNSSKGLEYAFESYAMHNELYKEFNENHLEIAHSLSLISFVYLKYGDGKNALNYANKAYEAYKCNLIDKDESLLVNALANIGLAYIENGNVLKGLDILMSSNEFIMQKYSNLQVTPPDVIVSLENLAYAYLNYGNYEQALANYELAILKTSQNNIFKLNGLINKGLVNVKNGNGYLAIELFIKALVELTKFFNKYYNLNAKTILEEETFDEKYLENLIIHSDIAQLIKYIGLAHLRIGNYEKSFIYLEKSLQMYKLIHNTNLPDEKFSYNELILSNEELNHIDIANGLNDLGLAYLKFGNYMKSIEILTQGFQMKKLLFKPNENSNPKLKIHFEDNTFKELENLALNAHLADSLNNLGLAYLKRHSVSKGIAYCEEALKIYYDILDAKDSVVKLQIKKEHNISVKIPDELENNEIISEYYFNYLNRKINDYNEYIKEFHPKLANITSNLAYGYILDGDTKQALINKIKSFIIRYNLYSPNNIHIDIATSLNGIGLVLFTMEEHYSDKCFVFFNKALEITNRLFNYDHIDKAVYLSNLGLAWLILKNDHRKCLDSLSSSFTMLDIMFGNDHPEIASVLAKLGVLYHENKNYDRAKKIKEKTLKMKTNLYGKENMNHYEIADALNSLGVTLAELKNKKKAVKCFQQALDIINSLNVIEDVDLVVSLFNTGQCWYDLNERKKAISYIKQVNEVKKILLKRNTPGISLSLRKIPETNLKNKSKCF